MTSAAWPMPGRGRAAVVAVIDGFMARAAPLSDAVPALALTLVASEIDARLGLAGTDRARVVALAGLGVDGVITNTPGAARTALGSAGG